MKSELIPTLHFIHPNYSMTMMKFNLKKKLYRVKKILNRKRIGKIRETKPNILTLRMPLHMITNEQLKRK